MPYEILLQHASIVSCLCVFGISQSSLGRIMAQENLPSLITLEKICTALGVTLLQFFQEGNSENLTEEQKEVLIGYGTI
ncbi:MAG: helix-turn-helix domain-containing protein [Anaerobutyricum soehngenii]